jgi:hypothetical protein
MDCKLQYRTNFLSDSECKEFIEYYKDNESKAYKMTKELGIKYCKMMIKHLPEWYTFLEKQKKKDDLADAFLQGAYYFEMNVKADPSEKNYKKKNSKKKENSTPIIKVDIT